MDLLEDFDRARAALPERGAAGDPLEPPPGAAAGGFGGGGGFGGEGGGGFGGGGGGVSYADLPSLTLEATTRQAARGRGQIVAAAAGSDTLLLATSRGYLLRYQWDEHGNERVVESELTRAPQEVAVRSLFTDPGGSHALAVLRNGRSGAYETHYIHRSWTKARALTKLAGLAVTAAGWQRQPRPQGAPGGGGGGGAAEGEEGDDLDNTTGDLLLGTEGGSLHLTRVDQRAPKKEVAPTTLLDWGDRKKAVCAICQEVLPCGARVVLVATPGALYIASGAGPGLEGAFARFSGGPAAAGGWEPLIEVAVPSLRSRLLLPRPGGPRALPARFAWLVGGSICHGHLLLQRFALDASVAAGDPQEYVGDMRQLPLAPAGVGVGGGGGGGEGGATPEDEPSCMAVTEYHYILLHHDRLAAVNQARGLWACTGLHVCVRLFVRVSGRVVAEAPLTGAASGVAGAPLLLLQEGGAGQGPALVTGDALYEVGLSNEGRGMWRTYLEHEDYDSALRLAAGPAQRDAVYIAMAEDSFARGDRKAAAAQWGRVVGGRPPFEEVALRLVEAGEPNALATFLSTKLQVVPDAVRGRADTPTNKRWKTQSNKIHKPPPPRSFLTQYVDVVPDAVRGRADTPTNKRWKTQSNKIHKPPPPRSFLTQSFLTQYVDVLDVGTTTGLLASYGRLEELQHFAAARGDDEALLDYLMQRPDGAMRALAVLRKPGVSTELVYKFAPPVVAQATDDAVDYLVSRGPALDPRRLLPALARFGEPGAGEAGRGAALRYVRFAIEALRCADGTLHNLAVCLLSLDQDEGPLLDYLARAGRDGLGRPLYDAKYALRLARDRDRRVTTRLGFTAPRACVKLLSQLGLHQDAVALALERVDLDLAKAVVDLDLAKAVAETGPPEDDEGLRRKLWLEIARRVVQEGGDESDQAEHIAAVMGLLREAGGLLRIEDVLPLFPDFVTIDAFKAAIVDSLQRYSEVIEDLKREMDEATAIAEAVRSDLKLLSGRTATLSGRQPCARCGRPVAGPPPNAGGLPAGGAVPPFYVFPTGLAYHVLCAAEEVCAAAGPPRAKRVRHILTRLSKLDPSPPTPASVPASASASASASAAASSPGGDGGGGEGVVARIAALSAQLEEEVGAEDPWNGELVARLVGAPFVDAAADAAEIEAWRV
ncbi:MAG: hypothetical protein J3K34DRAFT_462375 [Monoraphidium minutum]|nr:MAG: hypothetical protein J3K34DRAFT_462375 [Monoraphidium minutum]